MFNRSVVYTAPELPEEGDPKTHFTLTGKRKPHIFLCGGITNCPDWQGQLLRHMSDVPAIFYNPRRPEVIDKTGSAAEEQITWEHERIRKASFVVFWFSRGSLNPIVLFEYGKELGKDPNRVIVGVDQEYERKYDVVMQTELDCKQLPIAENLKILERNIRRTVKRYMREQK